MEELIKQQKIFFDSGITLSYHFRIHNLNKLYEMINKNKNLILKALYNDLHKSYYESFETEIGTILSEINYLKKHLSFLMLPKLRFTPLSQFGSIGFVYPKPFGVVLNISPWNYPFQLAIAPLIGSIASGNCTILKVSEYSTNTSSIIHKLLDETFNSNYISCVEGDHEITESLIASHPDYLFFTGSPATGKKIMEQASKNLIPLTLELGGKSPCIVDQTANLKLAARRIVWGKFMNAGQTCIAPDYLMVHSNIKDKLVKLIFNEIYRMYGTDLIHSSLYPHIINNKQYARLIKLFDKTQKMDENIQYAGNILFNNSKCFIAPTLITNATYLSPFMQEEIFGPILPIITYDTFSNIIPKLQKLQKPLALYIFSKSHKHIKEIIKYVPFGSGCVNDVVSQFAVEGIPFGGIGNSGMGNYHGKYSFKTLSHYQGVLFKSNLFDIPWKYLNHQNIRILKKFLH